MPITMSRRKQSNPKPLKSDSDVEEPMDDSSSTSPTPEHDMDRQESNRSTILTEMDALPDADDQGKAVRRVEWPVKEGTKLGPFSARIAVVQEDCVKENSICVRGSSKALFSIFILEYYTEEMLSQTNIRPANVNGPKAAIVYIYKPDKQLYLLTLKDVGEHESIPTVFLEGVQDRHPGSGEVDDLLQKEVAAETLRKSNGGASSPAPPSPSEGASPKTEQQGTTSPYENSTAGIQEPLGVPSVSCQSCGVTFRNPANLSAHQLYYCAARETTPVPPSTRSRPPRHSSTPREAYAADQAAKETGQPEDLVCILCKARFSNLTNCLSHMIKLHTEQNSQACKCCNFISVDIKLLKEHMLIHVRGSGINPNIFMASQGSHALMGPLSFHRTKDRRFEEKRKRKKHHQAPGNQAMSPPYEYGGSSSSTLDLDQDQTDVTKNRSSVKGSERSDVLTTDSINAEPERSQSISESRRTPPTSSSDHGKAQNELQTRPIGRFLCVECDIYFSSHKNFVAHKQFYCQGHTKERKQAGHVQVPPLPTPPVPLVQCGNCGAVFPSRDKLAVHTLYFCHCRKPGKHSAQDSEALPNKSSQQGRSSPKNNQETGSHDDEKVNTKSDSSNTKEDSSAKPHIKVEPEEESQGSDKDKDHKQDVPDNEHVSPNAPSFNAGMASNGQSPGSVLLAPGNVPTYIGRQGNSPVYIVASHVFVTPPGDPGSRGIPQVPYPPFHTAIPGGQGVVFKGEHGAPVPGERPLDLTVRKRKGCEESVSEDRSASKVLKNESVDQKSTPSSPTSQSDTTSSILPPFNLPNFPGHVQYKCPGCHIAFNRLESLDIHRQFYCQSEGGSGNQTPVLHPSTSIPVHTTLPALPYYQIVTNPNPANGSALVPALATVNLRDNHSATSESKGNEGSPSLSKARSSSSPSSEAMEGVNTSNRTSPSHHESDSKENKSNDQLKGTKVMHLHSGKSSETIETQRSKGSSPSSLTMSPTLPGSPKSLTRFPGGQNGESSESGGQNIPMYVPSVVRYMCPACGVSFMKLESLSAHQHFYCRASQEALNRDGGSPKGKGIVPPDSIPRTTSLMPRSSSRSSESASIPEIRRPSSGHASRRSPVAMDTGEKTDTGEAVQGQLNGSNIQAVLTRSEKCDDSGNESRTSLSPDDSAAHDNASGINVKCKGSRKEKDDSCQIKIKVEKEEENYDAPTNAACSITDNNNVTHVKLEKLDDNSCCSGTEKLLPKSCRQENGNNETGTMHNGCQSPESSKGGEDGRPPQAADSTESTSEASPPGGMNGSRHNGSGATAGAAGRPAPVMLKHCRACNISFSSLSTFIAHKKYYCASHHVAKNPVH